nr:DNA-directed DNA polymerase [Tanacetum cinerariifolium]
MVKTVDTKCETCGGPYSFTEFPAIGGYTQETSYATTGGVSYDRPPIPPPTSYLPKMVERVPEVTKDTKLREKDDNLALKFVEIFRKLHFELSFADALLHMPKFALMFKSLLNNKENLSDLATTPVNENCSAFILKKLPEKLGDPDKFLIPCDFLELDECLALADLETLFEDLTSIDRCLCDAESVNQIDVIYVACEEYVQEVLRFSEIPKSGSPTPTSNPIISSSSPSFTPFEGSDFILEEIKTFLQTPNELSNLDDDYYDTEGDILYFENLLNEDPSSNLPPVKTEDLKQVDATMIKPLIEEPPELELKELSSHLEYTFLEGTDKLPIIISKELKDEEKSTLLKDDFKPMVQHQRRVNPKIHEVIKKEVIKLLDAGLIYPISDSPWVSPVHCVPKKGGMTVIENEDNELIPTRLVTGWRFCIDYQKLNDATRKDHFPLPFMDQMLERLFRNEFYCFLDGISGYFHILIDQQDQEKTTFTCPYETFAYRRIPFGLCNVPGTFQRCEDTNLVLNWEKCHFMVKEGIVLGHKNSKSGIKVDIAKVDVIAKIPHPTSVKGAKNLAADHLSILENPHQDELEKKEITETFPLETLGMIAFCGDSSTPWFADIGNYHAGNFIVKGMSSQQKKKFFKDVKYYFWEDPLTTKIELSFHSHKKHTKAFSSAKKHTLKGFEDSRCSINSL